jgi:hypothetical protein
MTTIAVLADPSRAGQVLPALVEDGLVTDTEATELYAALLVDVCVAVDSSGAELLVNYRPDEQVPGEDVDSASAVRATLEDVIDTDATRFEVQVGSTFSARVGNTITHLLDREGVRTAAAVTPSAALLGRQHIDSAAMKLRSNDVVLGPSTDGRVTYAGFAEPIDFEDAYAGPQIETLVERATDAGLSIDFLPTVPVLSTPADLATVVPQLRARQRAGRLVPTRTMDVIDSLGLRVVEAEGETVVERP